MTEELLVRHCAPTLAGLKAGSLFTCAYDSKNEMTRSLRAMNRRLVPKGLRVLPLRYSGKRALIYLYRPSRLKKDLAHNLAKTLLEAEGYCSSDCNRCIVRLADKVRSQQDFPHEIGLFLGYPPEDVSGFIHNKACDHKCVGCWKVYGDPIQAQKTFDKYNKCTRVYCSKWKGGRTIEQLTVAG